MTLFAKKSPAELEREFLESLDRVEHGRGRGEHKRGPVDVYDQREAERDMVRGRDRDPLAWRPVMEFHGFRWFEAEELDRRYGLLVVRGAPQRPEDRPVAAVDLPGAPPAGVCYRPHGEGEWRNDVRRQAFTLRELAANFVHPAAFDAWIREQAKKKEIAALAARARRAGLHLPAGAMRLAS